MRPALFSHGKHISSFLYKLTELIKQVFFSYKIKTFFWRWHAGFKNDNFDHTFKNWVFDVFLYILIYLFDLVLLFKVYNYSYLSIIGTKWTFFIILVCYMEHRQILHYFVPYICIMKYWFIFNFINKIH